jgi:hypothetical protein
MVVPESLQENMIRLRDTRPGLKEKYSKFPFEEVDWLRQLCIIHYK